MGGFGTRPYAYSHRRSVIYAGEDACATFTAARAAGFPELNRYKNLYLFSF